MELWLSFADRNQQMNATTYVPFHKFMTLVPSMGKTIQGDNPPKRRHFFCHPLLHIFSFSFKSPVNHAI